MTNPIWETVETCWKTRPSDRLTVVQLLEVWEREINGIGLPAAAEQGERKRSWTISGSGGTKTSVSLPPTLGPLELIGSVLGGNNTPWWKVVCGGSEQQYAQ